MSLKIDGETGCTVPKMDEADRMLLHLLKVGDPDPSDAALRVRSPREMSVSPDDHCQVATRCTLKKGVA